MRNGYPVDILRKGIDSEFDLMIEKRIKRGSYSKTGRRRRKNVGWVKEMQEMKKTERA